MTDRVTHLGPRDRFTLYRRDDGTGSTYWELVDHAAYAADPSHDNATDIFSTREDALAAYCARVCLPPPPPPSTTSTKGKPPMPEQDSLLVSYQQLQEIDNEAQLIITALARVTEHLAYVTNRLTGDLRPLRTRLSEANRLLAQATAAAQTILYRCPLP